MTGTGAAGDPEELMVGRFVVKVSDKLSGEAALVLGELVVVARQPTTEATLALVRQAIGLAGKLP